MQQHLMTECGLLFFPDVAPVEVLLSKPNLLQAPSIKHQGYWEHAQAERVTGSDSKVRSWGQKMYRRSKVVVVQQEELVVEVGLCTRSSLCTEAVSRCNSRRSTREKIVGVGLYLPVSAQSGHTREELHVSMIER